MQSFSHQHKVENLGQVFTPSDVVQKMLSLRKNSGSVLEPSAGDGAFWEHIKDESNSKGYELDPSVCPKGVVCADFFTSPNEKYSTIIGNPPYVSHANISEGTKNILYKEYPHLNKHTNLFAYFIDKCIDMLEDDGELIFIVPSDFVSLTSCGPINEKMKKLGTITYFYDYGDQVVFKGFNPNCCIFRFEKGNFSNKTLVNDSDVRDFKCNSGNIIFSNSTHDCVLSDLFEVKVGAASGANQIFESPHGNEEFVISSTRKTGKTKKFYFNIVNPYIESKKEELLKRKVTKFDESNWWKWGRIHDQRSGARIYVNCKTRVENPFFTHECENYDGSVLALYPKFDFKDINKVVDALNSVKWGELQFKIGGRYIFTQRSLSNCPINKEDFVS